MVTVSPPIRRHFCVTPVLCGASIVWRQPEIFTGKFIDLFR